MTLCIVWRTVGNICFASDSRLTFDMVSSDTGIKVVRIPFSVHSPAIADQIAPVVNAGDIGMTFCGSSIVALMVKEALAEVVYDIQGIPGQHDMGMDGISDLMFRGYQFISKSIGAALYEKAATCIVFAGYCIEKKAIRAFKMETDQRNNHSISEVLNNVGDYEILGTGSNAARILLQCSKLSCSDFLKSLQIVIDDPKVDTVGGNIQYGRFIGKSFQPMGVAECGQSQNGIHHWRGPLDLNGLDFDQGKGLLPRFPYLDRI